MECAQTPDLLGAYLDGDLPERERREIAAHLDRCGRCAGEEKALRETMALLRNLPPEQAPADLLEGVRRRIAKEKAPTPLWRKLFLPAHIKIPIEAAAAVVLFLLVYGVQKEMPATKAPPSPPLPVAGRAAEDRGREKRDRDGARPEERYAAKPGGGAKPGPPEASGIAPPGTDLPAVAGGAAGDASPEPAAPPSRELLEVPATRVSTGGDAVRSPFPPERTAGESAQPRVFAAPPSRLLRPMPSGREVTLEVGSGDRAGLDERIEALAERLGGTIPREGRRVARTSMEGTAPAEDAVRVHVPADSAEDFLEELKTLGTIPPEGMPARVDLPAGPSPGIVAYTVRIRVR